MSFPRMSLHIGDYLKDTRQLRAAEHGAYLLLIMHYWSKGNLPDDDRQLAAIACMSDREWKKSKPLIQSFFGPKWIHKRIEHELATAQAKYDKRVTAGRKGGIATSNATSNAKAKDPAKPQQPITPTDKELDDGEDAGARGEISREAFSISEKLYLIFNLDPEFIPPGWCGAPRWVQKCLNEDIPPDVIISSAEGVKGRKRDGPPDSFVYLEKPLARDWARQKTPLPTVEFKQETINGTAPDRRPRGGISPITAVLDGFIAEGERAQREAIDGGEIREVTPRLLSHRGG